MFASLQSAWFDRAAELEQPEAETLSAGATLLRHWSSWINYNSNGGGEPVHVCVCEKKRQMGRMSWCAA